MDVPSITLRRIGSFTAAAFLAGTVLMFVLYLFRGMTAVQAATHPYTIVLTVVALLFWASTLSRQLFFLQPFIFLIIAPVNFLESQDSFYGLGFFVLAVLLFFKLGFLDRYRVPKLVGLLVYLYGWELFAAVVSGRDVEVTIPPVFFVTVFLAFLYILYNEQIIVYLKEPKPILDLRSKGLAASEISYILAMNKGMSPKEIAAEFEVSDSTVRNTLARSYRKLGVKDKAELSSLLARHTVKAG
ncbi:MAG TPA: LuxR C-terminal-related transcriptional regulator [Magnetospirillaceae bacterium]|nr:LuxR C-terminal-related transcriptional regulator [Magnetospirillaceae bacterium]